MLAMLLGLAKCGMLLAVASCRGTPQSILRIESSNELSGKT
jgi:hypothetical protein